MQMVALSTTKIRWSESYFFYPLWTLIFRMSTFCSNYSSSISLTQCQYTSWELSFEFTIDLSSLFCNLPQICSIGLRSGLWGGLPSQVVPAIVCFMGIVMANKKKKLKPLKYAVMNLVTIAPHGLLHHTTAAHHSTSDYNSHHSLHLRHTFPSTIAPITH